MTLLFNLIKKGECMAIQPLADRIVVKALEAKEVTKGGILLPETAKEKPQEGKVIAVGKGKILDSGNVQALEVKVGDRVLYGKYSGTEITTTDGEELLIMKEEDILAIVK
jgi:chaperonin GroES